MGVEAVGDTYHNTPKENPKPITFLVVQEPTLISFDLRAGAENDTGPTTQAREYNRNTSNIC